MRSRDDAELVHIEGPDTFDVSKQGSSAGRFFDVPHLDGARNNKTISTREMIPGEK